MDALVGTIVGGVLAITGGVIAKTFSEWRQKESLRTALRAEVAAISSMFEKRGHRQLFEELLQNWKAGRKGRPRLIGSLTKPIDPIFSKNSDKIGLLGRDVAGEIVRFYAIMDGIREDIHSLALGELDPVSQEKKIRLIEDDLRLLTEAQEIASQLRATL